MSNILDKTIDMITCNYLKEVTSVPNRKYKQAIVAVYDLKQFSEYLSQCKNGDYYVVEIEIDNRMLTIYPSTKKVKTNIIRK